MKKLRETDENVVAYADVKAASDLRLAFSEANVLHLLGEIYWDDEMLTDWQQGNTSRFQTFIIVGLFSNSFFSAIVESPIRKLFKLEGPKSGPFQLAIARRYGDALGWYAPHEIKEGDRHFALVAKVALNKEQNAFLIGGLNAKGTERIGEYIRDNWETIYNHTDSTIKPSMHVKGNEFAMSVAIPLQGGTPSPEHCIINR